MTSFPTLLLIALAITFGLAGLLLDPYFYVIAVLFIIFTLIATYAEGGIG